MERALTDLLPHRAPMLLLESFDGVVDGEARCTVRTERNNPYLRDDGTFERAAYAEMIAQCFAAAAGAAASAAGGSAAAPGYLAALKDVRVFADACAGDVLHATARHETSLGPIHVVSGEVRRGDERIASASLKLYLPGESA